MLFFIRKNKFVLSRDTASIQYLDWKFPVVFSSIYVFFCIVFESLFSVPGNISLVSIFVFFLPYLGCSLALFLCRSKKLFLDSHLNIDIRQLTYHYRCINWLVLFSLILQIITWIYILFNVELVDTAKEFFSNLRNASIAMQSVVPIWLSYPNGLCFASFCLAFSRYRIQRKAYSLLLVALSVLTIFLNDLQTSGRAGMAFIVFVFLASAFWDWRVNFVRPLNFLLGILGISIFTQLPKVLRDGHQSIAELKILFADVLRYCFSYLNTLTELLNRLPEPNWAGERTLLPIYNLVSRLYPLIERSGIHSIERSQVWGYNNYTIAGDLLRDFSFLGCFIIPFLITLSFIFLGSYASRPLNIAITIYFSGWIIYGSITNILILGGFLISLLFLFSLVCIENIYSYKYK